MYAIVDISGKQFRAEEGLELKVPHQREEEGKKISFDRVLLLDDGSDDVKVGQPTVSGSAVEATVLEHGRDRKVPVFKKKRRKGYRVKNTHRQEFTVIRVENINNGTSKKTSTKKSKDAAKEG